MKLNDGDTNKKLGILALGLFFANLGYFIDKFVKNTSLDFFNGFKSGACAGLMIIGVFLFIYGLVGVIKNNKK